jgi:ABC-type ATPase with predicted acetyltransferase domain
VTNVTVLDHDLLEIVRVGATLCYVTEPGKGKSVEGLAESAKTKLLAEIAGAGKAEAEVGFKVASGSASTDEAQGDIEAKSEGTVEVEVEVEVAVIVKGAGLVDAESAGDVEGASAV